MSTDPQAAPRRLPDRPSLRHLKDQAKDLLKTGAATSITDAQFKIARLYVSVVRNQSIHGPALDLDI